jgi:beta-lactamase regulating signal transducer with metallopeptidase domain
MSFPMLFDMSFTTSSAAIIFLEELRMHFASCCFYPVAWLLYSRLGLERGIACDQAVVRSHPENRARYAECLVRFARRSSIEDNHAFGIDFAAESGHLHARIKSILAVSSGHSCGSHL